MNKIITDEQIEEVKKLIRQRRSHEVKEILDNLEEIKKDD
jgi:hypothetical protein